MIFLKWHLLADEFLPTGSAVRTPGSQYSVSPGWACAPLYSLHNNVYIWCCFHPRSPVFVCLFLRSVGAGTVMDGKHTPIPQPLWPCSLTPYSYIFFLCTPHTAASSPITQTDTHAHAPTAPVAPPRLLRVEQGDPGPMRQAARGGGGGQPGENLPRLSLLKLFSSGWQIRGDTSTRGDCTKLRGWGWTTIICPPLMLVKLFFMLARREGLKYN